MRKRRNCIFVIYLLFQHLTNCLLILNGVKLDPAVVFIKYTASVVPLIFPLKTLI